jgi:hypothetical protein
MNKLFSLTLVASLIGSFVAPIEAPAQQFINQGNFSGGNVPLAFFGQGVTNISAAGATANSNKVWFVAAASPFGIPRIDQILATSDLIPSVEGFLQFYYCTNVNTLTNAGASGTNALWCDTAGLASNDVVVLRSIANNFYQRLFVTNWTASNIYVHPLAAFAVSVGDLIYKETPGPTMNLSGATNYSFQATGVAGVAPINVYGRVNQPLLVDFSYSNAANIKLISGTYLPYRDR